MNQLTETIESQLDKILMFLYAAGILLFLFLMIDLSFFNILLLKEKITLWCITLSIIPVGFLLNFYSKKLDAHAEETILKNRAELFSKIPKEELFKEGSIFVDKFEKKEAESTE